MVQIGPTRAAASRRVSRALGLKVPNTRGFWGMDQTRSRRSEPTYKVSNVGVRSVAFQKTFFFEEEEEENPFRRREDAAVGRGARLRGDGPTSDCVGISNWVWDDAAQNRVFGSCAKLLRCTRIRSLSLSLCLERETVSLGVGEPSSSRFLETERDVFSRRRVFSSFRHTLVLSFDVLLCFSRENEGPSFCVGRVSFRGARRTHARFGRRTSALSGGFESLRRRVSSALTLFDSLENDACRVSRGFPRNTAR